MKVLLAIVLLVLVVTVPATTASAQEVHARNTFYMEMGGAGMLYSINYDRMLNDHISIRGGASIVWGFAIIPLSLNGLIGNGPHKLEIGGGPVMFAGDGEVHVMDTEDMTMILTTFLGYRYQPLRGGLNFRAGVQPLFLTGDDPDSVIWGAASIGVSF